MTLERRKSPGEAWETVPVSSGGSQPQSETVTVTTDPNTFTVTEAFDVGAPGIVVFKFTLTAVTPDGETFGPAAGNIACALAYSVSPDGINWANATALAADRNHTDANENLSAVAQFFNVLFGTLREGRGILSIVNSADSSPYAGANHPTATVRLDYSVITLGAHLT